MKKGILFYCVLVFCMLYAPSCVYAQSDPIHVIQKFLDHRANYESLSYSLDYKRKTFAMHDTLQYLANVDIVKVPGDSLFNGMVSIDMDTIWLGYDGDRLMSWNRNTSLLLYGDAKMYPDLFIKSTEYNDLVDEGFLKKSTGILQVFNDSTVRTTYKDTLIDDAMCLGLKFRLPDSEEFSDQVIFVAIDTTKLFVKRRSYSVFFQGNEQYQEWNFSDVEFGHDQDIPILHVNTISDFLKLQQWQPFEYTENEQLNFDFSQLKGKILAKDKNILLGENINRFTLLDFWYTACYPCIKAIPAINELSQKYKSKGIAVYGVNMIDDEAKSKDRLNKFLVNNPMVYETIMLDQALRTKIPIHGFPTFLILDENYKVIFKEEGLTQDLFEKVSAILDEQLKD